MKVPRLSSSGVVACGFDESRGFQGVVSWLSGLGLNASWGFRMFWFRNALAGWVFFAFDEELYELKSQS